MKLLQSIRERGSICTLAIAGEAQRVLGLPLTFIGTHRQAVEHFKQKLIIPSELRGRVVISALRNRSWIGVAVYTACVLRQMGYEATLLYRGSEITRFYPSRIKRFDFWSGVADIPGIELVDLEAIDISEQEMAEFAASVRNFAPSALAYNLHLEEQDVREGDAGIEAKLQDMIRLMMRMGSATKKVLARNHYHRFILYSGLIGESPAMLECGRRLAVPTVCLEGWAWRHGHLIYNHNAPALDYDIQGWLNKIQPWDEAKEQQVNQYTNFLEGGYSGGSDWLDNLYSVQRSQVSASLPPGLREFVQGDQKIFLAAPNVIGDSSMLSRETIFPGQQKWLVAVIDYFRGKPDAKLIIRAHPAEVWVNGKVRIKMAEVARHHSQGASNIHIIEAKEKVNTFTLLPFVQGGLVWLSSVGVDMVVRGVPVIAAARPKYTGMGIVKEPASTGQYFAVLDEWLRSAPRPSAQQVLMAKQYLYIVFKGFSYEAWSKNTFITGCRLNAMPNQAEHDAFYQALVAEQPKGVDLLRTGQGEHVHV